MSKVEILIGIVVFVYAIYIYQVYKDSGKQAAVKKLKEHFVVGGGTVVFLAVSIWLTGKIAGLIGAASVGLKFLIWCGLLVLAAIAEMVLILPKRRK